MTTPSDTHPSRPTGHEGGQHPGDLAGRDGSPGADAPSIASGAQTPADPTLDKAAWGHETLAKDDFERGLVSALDNPSQLAQDQMPEVVDQVALAKLYGEPLFSLPQDLYIPPDALEVFLEAFEGPLDLLLYLIRKQNFNILDIPMAALTHQYLSYVEEIRQRNLELAAEYLLMAAMLIEIKSRMLLPPKRSNEAQEVQDPRAELVRRLLEYEKMKLAAAHINELPQLGRDFLKAQVFIEQSLHVRLPQVHAPDLQQAWSDILKRAKWVQHHKISRAELSVREHMSMVLRKLQGQRFVEFESLFDVHQGTSVLVVTFVALLELAKEMLVEITQGEVYAPIYVRLAYTSVH